MPKLDYRATPVPIDVHEDGMENERRFRASLEEAFGEAGSMIADLTERLRVAEALLVSQQATLDDHETRITALETP